MVQMTKIQTFYNHNYIFDGYEMFGFRLNGDYKYTHMN
jgi:hypothetical protein